MSPKFFALSGTPFTNTFPPSTTTSSGEASRRCAPIWITFSRTFSAALCTAMPPTARLRLPNVPTPMPGDSKVSPCRTSMSFGLMPSSSAAVGRDAADRVEREGVGRDEVLAAELGRVHPDLVGETVDDPLHRVGRLGAAGAAVGIHGRRVGVCAADLDVESRNDVGPGNDE